MEPIISIRDLSLSISGNSILKDISIDIPKNKITVILGPSGCGKTTLLRCLNRLSDLNPQVRIKGSITMNGEDILHTTKDVTEIRRKAGLLSQRPYPLPMNIFNYVAYGLRITHDLSRAEMRQRVEEMLRQVSLWDEVKDRLKEPAGRLSIGQQQRLCLARGLAVRPEVILADEPTSALDPISSEAIEKKFQELKPDYSIVMVTHVLRQARRIADYVVFMYLGEVVEQGPADEIFENPREERTKAYLKGAYLV